MPADSIIKTAKPTFGEWKSREPEQEIAVLMSGGVDSSSTALLLQREGWRVVGITMEIPIAEGCSYADSCCGGQAAVVCHYLDIPHYFLDTTDAFQKLVIERFRHSYKNGYTPNPCIDCNSYLKFTAVWDFIEKQFGIHYLATGHYARISSENDKFFLHRGVNLQRDQSYFIYGIPPHRLPYLRLPMGEYKDKDTVRRLAADAVLPVADKPDSMELCFAGENNYRSALGEVENQPGSVLTANGEKIGEHQGIEKYTVGQRRGLGIPWSEPLYVIALDRKKNAVIVGPRSKAVRRLVTARTMNVLLPEKMKAKTYLFGKVRSYTQPAACQVIEISENEFSVAFETPQFAPAPGQHLVLYDSDDNVVAGGEISTPPAE